MDGWFFSTQQPSNAVVDQTLQHSLISETKAMIQKKYCKHFFCSFRPKLCSKNINASKKAFKLLLNYFINLIASLCCLNVVISVRRKMSRGRRIEPYWSNFNNNLPAHMYILSYRSKCEWLRV